MAINVKEFNKSLDVMLAQICRYTTQGLVDDLIVQLKPYIHIFDYQRIVQTNRGSHIQMRDIVDIVQKGKEEAKWVFLDFLPQISQDIHNFVKEKSTNKTIKCPNPEGSFGKCEYKYQHQPMPRISSGKSTEALKIENMTLTDTVSGLSSSENNGATDVHTSVRFSDAITLFNNFRQLVQEVLESLQEKDMLDFKTWMLAEELIEPGTLSRCQDFNDIFYELEKRQLLSAFIKYNRYPSSVNVIAIQSAFQKIPVRTCTNCDCLLPDI